MTNIVHAVVADILMNMSMNILTHIPMNTIMHTDTIMSIAMKNAAADMTMDTNIITTMSAVADMITDTNTIIMKAATVAAADMNSRMRM